MTGRYMQVRVENVDEETEKYVVARFDEHTNKLWYYGSWPNKDRAEAVASQIGNGVVVENT